MTTNTRIAFALGVTPEALVPLLERLKDAGLVVQQDWQPIATAPKDGTDILGYWKRSRCYSVVSWMDNRWSDDHAFVSSPTHWQPLLRGPTP